MKLKISEDLGLPLEFASKAIAIVGIRGSGKTNTASVIIEELLDLNLPPVVIDPTDAWWGIRSKYPVFIFGGSHGDVPLADVDGKVVAQFVVTEKVPVVLSLRHLRKNAQRRFVTDFCEELYHLKGKDENRTALTVVIDECPLFVPQKVLGEVARTVGAVEDLITRGRNSGFGVVLIGQRPATINKDVLTQSDAIISHRITSPQDRKALSEWFEANCSTEKLKEILGSLSELPDGRAWVWAPTLDVMRQVQIRKRRTFDSSATPKIGEVVIPPKRLTEVNLDSLKGKMAQALKEAKENDPAALKATIRRLEAEAKRVTPAPAKPREVEIQVAVPMLPVEVVKNIDELTRRAAALAEDCHDMRKTVYDCLQRVKTPARPARDHVPPAARMIDATIVAPRSNSELILKLCDEGQERDLNSGCLKILAVIKMLGSRGIMPNRECVARWLDLHPNGGTYGTNLGTLRKYGYLEDFALTESGWKAPFQPLSTGFERALEPLNGSERNIMLKLNYAYSEPQQGDFDRNSLAAALGIHPNGGTYGTSLGRLRTMGLIPERGQIKLTEAALR